jgi:hypothetical protein
MKPTCRLAPLWTLLLSLLAACAEIPATHPLDPETPADQQARAVVTGRLVLPDGFDPASFAAASVELVGEGRQAAESVAESGAFTFDAIPAGLYVLNVSVPGLLAPQRVVRVDIGARVELGDVALRADLSDTNRGVVLGRARRAGAADDGHGDVRVEAVGTPFSTQTSSEGQFRLELPAAAYTLRFTATGYAAPGNLEIRLAPGEVLNLAEPVVLVGEPAAVRGVVRLATDAAGVEPVGAEILLPAVEVRLTRQGEATPAQIQRPGADGRFVAPDVAPGTYEVVAALPGFGGASAIVDARPGETTEIALTLTQVRAVLSGRVVRSDRTGAGEATVVLTGKDTEPAVAGLRLAARTTPGDDRFRLDGVPVGTWSVTATAEGYRTPAPVDLRIESGVDAHFETTLAPRVARMTLPPTSAGPVAVVFERDAELTHAVVWLDSPEPPPAAVFVPLGGPDGNTVTLDVPTEGPHTVFARLANRIAVEPGSGDALFTVVTPAMAGGVVVDRTPPEVLTLATVDGRRYVRRPDGLTELIAVCSDALTPQDSLTLRVEQADPPGGVLYEGPALGVVSVHLGPAEGAVSLTASCVDGAGSSDPSAPLTVIYDATPPQVVTFDFLNSPGQALQTNDRTVTLFMDVSDPSSGVDALALAEGEALDCASATYILPLPPVNPQRGVRTFDFTLPAVDGPRVLSMCVRDRAGNVGDRQSTGLVTLDTTPPDPPSLQLAGGARVTRRETIDVTVGGLEPGGRIGFVGDIDFPCPPGVLPEFCEIAAYEARFVPSELTFDTRNGGPADGLKVITAFASDAAGNRSDAVTAIIELDRRAPPPGQLIVADGAAVVHTRTVPVTIRDTLAERMWIREQAPDDPCLSHSCDAPGWQPFGPLTTLTLSEIVGDRQICWQMCDEAGNASTVGQLERPFRLGTYLPRPTPEFAPGASLSPPSVLALTPEASAPIVVSGRGLAADTRVIVGDFDLPCVVPDAAECQADVNGGCAAGGTCDATCGTTCAFTLPDELRRRAGTYVVSLQTPIPVENGLGRSVDVRFLDVVAPKPVLLTSSERGMTQAVVDGRPVRSVRALRVTGLDLLDNTQFRLGSNFATVLEITRSGDAGGRGATVLLRVSTENLEPSDLIDAPLVAVNPAPGGGESAPLAYGVNPEVVDCTGRAPCASNLRGTRTPLPETNVRAQVFRLDDEAAETAPAWQGPPTIQWLDESGSSVGGAERTPVGGVLPVTLHEPRTVRLADPSTIGPPVALYRATARNSGTFGAGVEAVTFDAAQTAFAVGDMNADGRPDVVTMRTNEVVVALADAAGGFTSRPGTPIARFEVDGRVVALGDLDGDGVQDVVVGGQRGGRAPVAVLFGDGRGGLESPRYHRPDGLGEGRGVVGDAVDEVIGGGLMSLALADVDGDGATDIVGASGDMPAMRVWRGDGYGRFGAAALSATGDTLRTAVLDDFDGDGDLDVVGTSWVQPTLVFLSGRPGDGESPFAPPVTVVVPVSPEGLLSGDLDHDGAPDVVLYDRTRFVTVENRGRGQFISQGLSAPALPDVGRIIASAALADVTGDGFLDLIASTDEVNRGPAERGQTLIAAGRGDGTFGPWSSGTPRVGIQTTTLADLDLDGTLDVLHLTGAAILVERGAGSSHGLHETHSLPTGSLQAVAGLHFTDFDLDGERDLLAVLQDGTASNFRDLSSTAVQGPARVDLPGSFVSHPANGLVASAVLDLGADGRPDLIGLDARAAVRVSTRTALGVPSGATPVRTLPLAFVSRANFAVGRFDADARDDLVLGYEGQLDDPGATQTSGLLVFTGAGAGLSAPVTLALPPIPGAEGAGTIGAVALGDLDANGRVDVIWSYRHAGPLAEGEGPSVGYRLGLGNGTFGPPRLESFGVFGPAVTVADFDRDGRDDVALYSERSGATVIAYTQPDGTFQPADPIETPRVSALAAFDLHGDGAPDLLVANQQDAELVVLANDGQGVLRPVRHTLVGAAPTVVAATVLNDDGRAHVVVGGYGGAMTHWRLPAATGWSQVFTPDVHVTPLDAARVVVAAQQTLHRVDALSVRVRLEGAGLNALRLRLRAPDGDVVVLRDPGAPVIAGEMAVLHYPADGAAAGLAGLHGWQPEGAWTLEVEGPGDGAAFVTDFTVRTHGQTFAHGNL